MTGTLEHDKLLDWFIYFSLDVLATVLEEMPPFPEKESNGILNLLKKKRPGRVPDNPGRCIYLSIYLSVYLSIYLSIYLPTGSSTYSRRSAPAGFQITQVDAISIYLSNNLLNFDCYLSRFLGYVQFIFIMKDPLVQLQTFTTSDNFQTKIIDYN